MATVPGGRAERATERVAVLMTPTEKAAYANRASSMGLSLGQFFREAGAAYAAGGSDEQADADALEAALSQLELSTVIRMNDKVEEMAGLMKEQQRRIDELNGRVIRLETVLELALNRSTLPPNQITPGAGPP